MSTIKVQQTKSAVGYNKKQRQILLGMGFRKMHQIVELPDNDATRGMINKVSHLVTVVDESGGKK